MTTTIPSTDVVVSVEPLFTEAERAALAGFLAGYSGLTRDAYALDLRDVHRLVPAARAAPVPGPPRRHRVLRPRHGSHAAGPAPTIARRLCTIAGFYRYAVEEELLEHSPAVHVRRPRLDYESHAIGAGPQRGRRRCSSPPGSAPERARADLAAGDQRAADLRSPRRRHRRSSASNAGTAP